MEFFGAVASQLMLVPLSLVQFVGFWASISLPLFYVPLLFTEFDSGVSIFVALLAVHVISLVLGHGYGREEPTVERTDQQ